MAGSDHFLGIAAKLMRRVLVDHARRRGFQKRGGDRPHVALDETMAVLEPRDFNLLALDRALESLATLAPAKRQSWNDGSSADSRWTRLPQVSGSPPIRSRGIGGWPSSGSCANCGTRAVSERSRWTEIEAVCQAALDRRPDERPDFVASECGDDDVLRREVEALLRHAESDAALLESSRRAGRLCPWGGRAHAQWVPCRLT